MRQILELPDMEAIISEATVVYQRPDKVKIQINKPEKQWLMLYETVGWYQKGNAPRQNAVLPATYGPLALYQFLPQLLNGSLDQLSKGYAVSGQKLSVNRYQIILSALNKEVNPEKILCVLNPNTQKLYSIELIFRERQAKILMEFTQEVINAPLAPDIFRIKSDAPDIRTK